MLKVVAGIATSFDIISAIIFFARVRATHFATRSLDWNMDKVWLMYLSDSWGGCAYSRTLALIVGYLSFTQGVWLCWWTIIFQFLYAFAFTVPLSNETKNSSRELAFVQYDARRPFLTRKSEGSSSDRSTRPADDRNFLARIWGWDHNDDKPVSEANVRVRRDSKIVKGKAG